MRLLLVLSRMEDNGTLTVLDVFTDDSDAPVFDALASQAEPITAREIRAVVPHGPAN